MSGLAGLMVGIIFVVLKSTVMKIITLGLVVLSFVLVITLGGNKFNPFEWE